MYRSCAPKRTGIYRVKGNINDFQLELKLRHVSEWLPVPKFEYTGAKMRYGHRYPESGWSSGWSDCFIYVPYEDQFGNNYYTHYNNYNPGSDYPASSTCQSVSSRSYASRCTTISARTFCSSDLAQLPLVPPAVDSNFQAQNPELCDGATASICISWQQKCFNQEELQRYSDASNCLTTLQRRYHRWTRDVLNMQRRYQLQLQHAEQKQRVRQRRSKFSHAKRRSPPPSEFSVDSLPPLPEDPDFAMRTCLIRTIIDSDLEELEADQLPPDAMELHEQGFQLMYVYAQLQCPTLLLSLRYQPAEGLLYVYPDFSQTADDMDYVFQVDNDCRQLYAYGFENVTAVNVLDETKRLLRPQLLLQQKQPRSAGLLHTDEPLPDPNASAEQLVNYYQRQRNAATVMRRLLEFQLPPKRMRRVTMLLQIHEAQHFEYPNVHVRYYVNPPAHTLLEPANPNDPFPLRGSTATCVGGGAERCAHLSHCWQLTLLCEEAHEPHQLLHIYFEVISVDRWERERCEGYAHFSCSLLAPLPPDIATGLRLPCMRPVGSWLDALNRYFIGGRSLFDFVGYFKTRSRENLMHNRLESSRSHAMRSTGTLLFSMQKVQQRHQQFGHHLGLDEDTGFDDDHHDKPEKPNVSPILQEVIAAYVEARERIEALLGNS